MGRKRRGHKDKAPATSPPPSSNKKPKSSKKKRKRSGSTAEIPNPKPIPPPVAAPSIEGDENGQYVLKPNPQAAAAASVQPQPNNVENKEEVEKMDDDEKKKEEEEAAEEKRQRPVKKPRAVNEPTSVQPQPNLPSSKNKPKSSKKKRNAMAVPEPAISPPAAAPSIEDGDNDSGEDADDQYILKPKKPQPDQVDEMEIEENKDGGSDDKDENQQPSPEPTTEHATPSKDAKDDSDSGESASEEDEGSSTDKSRPPLKPVPEPEPAEDDEEAPEKPGKREPITEHEHASQDGDDEANWDSGSEKPISVDEPSRPAAAAAAAANKRMKTESQEPQSGEQKKQQQQMFQRVFALDDEITILRGLVEYRDAKGVVPSPGKHMQEFYSIVQPSLGSSIKVGQLSEMVRRMKRKFESAVAHAKNGVELMFADEHDRNVYEISKGIWGWAAHDNVTDVTDARPSSMRNKRHGSKEQVGEDKEGSVITSCKFLGEALASIDNKHSIGASAKRVFEYVDENKIIALEEKFKKQRTAKVKHDLQSMDLLKDSVELLMDSIAKAG